MLVSIVLSIVATGPRLIVSALNRLDVTGAVSTASGSALIRLGDTTIVCGIKAETAEPDWDRPNEGWLGSCSRISPADISCAGSDET